MTTSSSSAYSPSFSSSSSTSCVAIEIGYTYVRAGFGGESEPRVEIPIQVDADDETPTDEKDDDNNNISHYLPLNYYCLLTTLDWEEKLTPLMDQVYRALLIRSNSLRVVVILSPFLAITEEDKRRLVPINRNNRNSSSHTPPPICQALERILLDYLQVPALTYIDADRAVSFALGRILPSSYSTLPSSSFTSVPSSKSSGSLVTIDIGPYETRCICIYDGAALYETLQIMQCGYHKLVKYILHRWKEIRRILLIHNDDAINRVEVENELQSSSSSSSSELNKQETSSCIITNTSTDEWDEKYVHFLIQNFPFNQFHHSNILQKGKGTSIANNNTNLYNNNYNNNIHTQPLIQLLHKLSSMDNKLDMNSVILEKVVHDCIYDFYFSLANPYSLLRGFLDTILACPIDLKLSMSRNVVFIGESLSNIPNIETHFNNAVCQLHTLFSTDKNVFICQYTDIPIPILDILWNKYYTLKPSIVGSTSTTTTTATSTSTVSSTSNNKTIKGFTIMYPLPYTPKHVAWIGGGILGSIIQVNSDSSSHFVKWMTNKG